MMRPRAQTVDNDTRRRARRLVPDQSGFTLVELLIAVLISGMMLGAAVAMMSQVSEGYNSQQDDAIAQDEARFALERIEGYLRMAGSNPYNIATSNCPAANTAFQTIQIDPNNNAVMDDVRIHADVNPPNSLIGGDGAAVPCATDTDEDLTIALNPATQTITVLDNNGGGGAQPITDTVITGLVFAYFDTAGNATAVAANVATVQISVTAQAPGQSRFLGQAPTYTLISQVRIRGR